VDHSEPVWEPHQYKMVRTRAHAYIENATGERELYDLGADPYQLDNLAGQRPELEAELEHRLDAMRNCKAQGCRAAERL